MSTNELRSKINIANLKNTENKLKKGYSIGIKQPIPITKLNAHKKLAERDIN